MTERIIHCDFGEETDGHSPGPWMAICHMKDRDHMEYAHIVQQGDERRVIASMNVNRPIEMVSFDAERIALCVNACEGFRTRDLRTLYCNLKQDLDRQADIIEAAIREYPDFQERIERRLAEGREK